MASLINVDREVGRDVGGWLLFSNPDSTRGRHHITIKASPDRGRTWPREHRLLLDEGNSAGYSCMAMIDDKTVGILYEGSQAHMTFQRIPLRDLVRQSPRPATRDDPASRGAKGLLLPRVFGSHMVLQAGAEIPIWGRAPRGETVVVTLGDETQVATVNKEGEWRVRLRARTATATPAAMRVRSADERIELSNVLIGEVWVCAGQSNMEWPLRQSAHGKDELAAADHPGLRVLNLSAGARGSPGSYTPQRVARLTPQAFCEGQWNVASRESADSFSAVAWYFGRHLQRTLKVPVGLICPAVGGTPTEAWIPREALAADPQLKGLVAGNWLDNERLGTFCRTRGQQNLLRAIQAGEAIPGDDLGPNHSFKPGFMWDAGIAPLIPYAIRGAIWYQGESNAETPARVREHGRLFSLLIRQWRAQWGQGDFPFLYVQLPAMKRPEWPLFREGQRRVLHQLKNVGMAVTLDTGLADNVHPPLKRPVGERLARWALGTTYGLKSHACYSGPLYHVAEREGDAMVVSFNHVGKGLKAADGRPVRHFETRGDDGLFHAAAARIIGRNTIAVSSPRVAAPTHVRYAWRPFPEPPVNLVNSAGLPASPFSTEEE
jgi:sialate O-acetylesterase